MFSDVKMDWCNTKVDGVELDPHVVYKNMVLHSVHEYCVSVFM